MPLLSQAFVGRDTELTHLREVAARGGAMVVVAGAPGVGKSRLVRELTSWAAARGGSVLVGRCSSTSRTAPLRPLREALMGAARSGIVPGRAVRPFVPVLATVVP